MKVYELVYGEYDDRGTVGMFATRELVERRIVEDALAGKCERVVEIVEHEVAGLELPEPIDSDDSELHADACTWASRYVEREFPVGGEGVSSGFRTVAYTTAVAAFKAGVTR